MTASTKDIRKKIIWKSDSSSSLYKVTEIEGKGLGCIAIEDIKKDSVILTESPQICEDTEEV